MMASGSYLTENSFGIFAGVFLILAQTVVAFKKNGPEKAIIANEENTSDIDHLPDTV